MSSDNSGSSEACSDSIAAQQEEQQPTQSRNDDNHRVLPLCGTSLPPLPLPQRLPATEENDTFAEIIMNRALHDPPRWGWTAVGGIADVLSPQERSRRHSTCKAYKSEAQRLRKRKPLATAAAAQLKDPPSYPTAPRNDIASLGPQCPEQSQSSEQNQSTSSKPVSFATPTSGSLSENPLRQPQNCDATEPNSNSESKTISAPATTIIAKPTAGLEGSTGEGNDSIPLKHETQRQDSSDDTGDKKQIPCDSDQTVQRDAETKKITDEPGTSSNQNADLPRQQPPKVDIGLEVIGISSKLLGMTIEQRQGQQQSTTDTNNETNDQEDEVRNAESNNGNHKTAGRRSKKHGKSRSSRRSGVGVVKSKYDCQLRSVEISPLSPNSTIIDNDEKCDDSQRERILDMYAYHQGREGMEARDADTGELLFAQQVTDTNHDFDAPKSTFKIKIEFPLEDEDDEVDEENFESGIESDTKKHESENKYYDNDNRNPRNNFVDEIMEVNNAASMAKQDARLSRKEALAMYREVITWDLLDPCTPTPLGFATSIGEEYGLSFGQTIDLAARISKQIENHIAESSHYREPIAVRENLQELSQERKIGPVIQPYRYDKIIQTEKEGGTFRAKRQNRDKHPRPSIINKDPKRGPALEPGLKPPVRNKNSDASEVNLEDELADELLTEVKKRSTAESVNDVHQNGNGGESGILKSEKNAICHICKKRVPMGFHFSCPMHNHVYCEFHVTKRLGITKESGVYTYSSCPICSLTCECAKCVRKLTDVAKLFKGKCIEQKKELHDVDFPNILSSCKNKIPLKELNHAIDLILDQKQVEVRRSKEEKTCPKQDDGDGKSLDKSAVKNPDKKSRTIQLAGQTMVPRPPLSDFPREVCNSGDFDARSIDAYFTAYSAEGRRPVSDVPDAWLDDDKKRKLGPQSFQTTKMKNNSEVQEDGNVDYCHICRTAGHLILCDFCPRGFHQDCLTNHNQCSPRGDQWECFVCKNEKTESEKDFVDGKESIDVISAAFLALDVTDDRALVGLEVLSIIHQMLANLIDYDFGYVFSKPVDSSVVPGYNDVVKCPMDVGTICSKLIQGDFAAMLNGSFSMDDLVTKVLNEIELIWRNCIMFNEIGSSVARMARVLRRRVKMICRRSIFGKLSDEVKNNVSNYARIFDDSWASGTTVPLLKEKDDLVSSDSWKLSAIANLKPRSDLQFIVKTTHGRPIAIVDSVSGRVVQLYSSAKSASKAVEIILKSGHRCEWNATASRTDLNLKLIAERSRNDPSSLLFGYRWLFLDDLNEGNVTFLKTICDKVEMRHDQYTLVFRSIEEALSSSHLSKTLEIDYLRKKLEDLPRNGNWTEIDGVKWRRPKTPQQRRDSPKEKGSVISTEEDLESGADPIVDGGGLQSWNKCAFLKKDLVTDQNLVGFDSIQLALQDWMQTALSSPTFPASEAQTMENFRKYYLDGDRNVDGMIWQTVDDNDRVEQEEKKETTKHEILADAMEMRGDGESQNFRSESTNQGENSTLSKSGESTIKSSTNEELSSIAVATANDQQEVVLEHSSSKMTLGGSSGISGKRKFLDGNEIDFQPRKEARLSVVTVE